MGYPRLKQGGSVMDQLRMKIKEGLTANNVTDYKAQFEAILSETNEFTQMVLDLGQTDNIDSVGVTFVIGIFKKMKAMDKPFKVVGASNDVQSLFRLMKLDQFFEMTD